MCDEVSYVVKINLELRLDSTWGIQNTVTTFIQKRHFFSAFTALIFPLQEVCLFSPAYICSTIICTTICSQITKLCDNASRVVS